MNLDNLSKDNRYLLACSFGPDSMALFYLLIKEGFSFDVAHVNYHLRGEESDLEEQGLREYCEKLGVKLYVKNAQVNLNKNIENECRKIRYSFFGECMEKNNYDAVLIAHNQDDVLETYLMQKKRRNCPQFFGINGKTHIFSLKIIRPLLSYSKSSLRKICDDNLVPYSIDSSNEEDIYLRNQIRHNVVANMSEEERYNLLKEINERNGQLEKMCSLFKSVDLTNANVLLDFDELTYLYAINEVVKMSNISYNLSKKQAFEIRKILLSDKPNIEMSIGDKLLVIKEYEHVVFKAKNDDLISYSYLIDKPVILDNEFFYCDLTHDASNLHIQNDDYPLTIRRADSHDAVTIKDYEVEVRRLFIDWKMPVSIRKRWPVIVNKDNRVIYIPRYQKDFVNDGKRNFYVKLK